jgi:hypothetical protein
VWAELYQSIARTLSPRYRCPMATRPDLTGLPYRPSNALNLTNPSVVSRTLASGSALGQTNGTGKQMVELPTRRKTVAARTIVESQTDALRVVTPTLVRDGVGLLPRREHHPPEEDGPWTNGPTNVLPTKQPPSFPRRRELEPTKHPHRSLTSVKGILRCKIAARDSVGDSPAAPTNLLHFRPLLSGLPLAAGSTSSPRAPLCGR